MTSPLLFWITTPIQLHSNLQTSPYQSLSSIQLLLEVSILCSVEVVGELEPGVYPEIQQEENTLTPEFLQATDSIHYTSFYSFKTILTTYSTIAKRSSR